MSRIIFNSGKLEVGKSIPIVFDFLKAKKAMIGEVRTYKNGVKYKKVAEGKWEKVRGEKKVKNQPEQGEQKKAEPEKSLAGESEKKESEFFAKIGSLKDEQQKEIMKMIADKKSAVEIKSRIDEMDKINNADKEGRKKIIDQKVNQVATKKLSMIFGKLKDMLASGLGGDIRGVVAQGGDAGKVLAEKNEKSGEQSKELLEKLKAQAKGKGEESEKIKKSLDDIFEFDLTKSKKPMPIGTVSKGRKKVAEGKWEKVPEEKNKLEDKVDSDFKVEISESGDGFVENEYGYSTWSVNSDPVFDEEGYELSGDDYILIDLIKIKKEYRGKGHGKDLLKKTIEVLRKLSEEKNMEVKLVAEPKDDDTEQNKLVELYEKYGFSVDKNQDGSGVIMTLK